MSRVEVLLTAHNRKAGTLRCLARLAEQRAAGGVQIGTVLVDDASTDGTAAAVRRAFPDVRVVEGSGHLYWNGGMRRALEIAMRDDPDFYLFLNDDTYLLPGALARLLETHAELAGAGERRCIVVGSTLDPATGRTSYGGWRKGGRLDPARMALLEPGEAPLRCHTMNGNCVLLPRDVTETVGNLDAAFTHRMGDLDYGFRAARAGCSIWIAPGHAGECAANPGTGLWVENSLGPLESWRRLLGPKGLPPREWLLFTSRHYGPLWPLFFAGPYLKNAWRSLLALAARRSP